MARHSGTAASSADFDRSVPVVLFKVGAYPMSQGNLGAIRSLGRVGISVYPVVEGATAPAALSRYAAGSITWPTSVCEPEEDLVEGLLTIGSLVARRSVLLCTDDEAATLIAERAKELSEWYILPPVPPELPRRLASKLELGALCEQIGIASPLVASPRTSEELEAFIEGAVFPVVAKNEAAWTRRSAPAVLVNTIVPSPEGLRTMAARWAPPFGVVLQEYIPPEVAEDWICNAWVGEDDSSSVVLTGVKFRMWPPDAGVATFVKTAANPEVAALSARIFEAVAYRGVADLDWRYDRRDGLYKLLDFNPRVGAQFRLFETDAGIDVVRAAHLDLTGRPIPAGRPLIGRSLTVEHLDIASRLSRKRRAQLPPGVAEPTEACSRSLAWFARDDLRPFFAMLWGAASLAAARLRPPRRARTAPAKASGNAPAPRLRQRRRQGPTRRSALRDERG